MLKRRSVRLGPITKGFASRLREAREKRGCTQTALGARSGVGRERIVYLEKGAENPRLHEVEQFANALGVNIQTLLGIEPPVFPRQMLEDLAHHLRGAADGLDQLLRSAHAGAGTAGEAKPSKRAAVEKAATLSSGHAKADPWPWIISNAQQLLEGDPRRAWNRVELCDALKAQGVRPVNTRGMHMAIMPRLRAAGLIVEKANGTFTAANVPEATRRSTEKTEKAPVTDAGLIQTNGNGTFVASDELVRGNDERETPPAAPPDDHGSVIASLAHEVDALAPRLTEMTPRERVAQLAVWAGRVRQIDEELTSKHVPLNSGLRSRLKMIMARIVKLRKSLGCGWVDATSLNWSTSWPIYIEYNRAAAASEQSTLSVEEEQIYFRDILKSVLRFRREHARSLDGAALVIEAAQVLDRNDRWLMEAKNVFGDTQDRRVGDSRSAEPFRRQTDAVQRVAAANKDTQRDGIPRSVLKITRGKTLLIAGGHGSHDTQRLAVKKGLQFKSVDWITGERHPNPVDLFSMAIRNKKYDIVLLMPGTDDTEPLVMACKEAGSRLLYLTRGPSIPSVAEAVSGQQMVGGHVPVWMEAR